MFTQNKGNIRRRSSCTRGALKAREEQLGPGHPDTLRTVENLAIVYTNQGRYKKAEQLHERALKGREEQLGPEHPDTLRTVQNLKICRSKMQSMSPLTIL